MPDISTDFFNAIPVAIRPLILDYQVLPGEDPKVYRALFVELWRLLKPRDVLLWLDLKKLVDLIWEGLRLGHIKTEILIAAQKKSLVSLLLSMTNDSVRDFTPFGNVTQAEQAAVSYFTDPVIKKEVMAQFANFNYSENTIDAVAFTQHAPELAMIEKMQMSNQACQLAVRRQFEEALEVVESNPGAPVESIKKPRQIQIPAHNDDKKDQPDSAANDIAKGKDEDAEAGRAKGEVGEELLLTTRRTASTPAMGRSGSTTRPMTSGRKPRGEKPRRKQVRK